MDRIVRENKQPVDDRGQIILVDAKYPGHQGLLKDVLHDMDLNSPEEMHLKSYKDTYQFLKSKKGEEVMSKWMEDIVNEAVNKALLKERIQTAEGLIEDGLDKKFVIDSLSKRFTDENLRQAFLNAFGISVD